MKRKLQATFFSTALAILTTSWLGQLAAQPREPDDAYRALLKTVPNVTGAAPDIATVYYVDAENGSDANDGLSPENAWKSTKKVNTFQFSPGSAVLFKRGQSFRGALTAGFDDMLFGAYGEGDKPVILASADLSDATLWQQEGSNVWRTRVAQEVGNIIMEGERCAVRKWALQDLTQPDEFFFQKNPATLFFYHPENPGQAHTTLEAALYNDAFTVRNRKNVIIENLHLKYSANHGVSVQNVENITVRWCDISYMGGALVWGMDAYRLGNGVQLWGNGRNLLIEGNRIWQMFDTGVTNQYFSGGGTLNGDQTQICYRNNVIWDCGMGAFEIAKDTGKLGDIFFDNNTVYNMGAGWSWEVGRHEFGGFGAAMHKNLDKDNAGLIFMRNNIFHTTQPFAIIYGNNADQFVSWPNLILDHNLYFSDYYEQKLLQIAGNGGRLYQYGLNQFESYRKLYGWDFISMIADPLFMDAERSDFRLSTGSPAIDAGVDIGNTADADGNLRYDKPDIGAYEYSGPTAAAQKASPRLEGFQLQQNFPNPFNAETTIRFSLPQPTHVTLTLYDVRGAEVLTLLKETFEGGSHCVNMNGESLPSGLYVFQLNAGDFSASRKMLLLK